MGEGELLPKIREKAREYQLEKQIVFAGVGQMWKTVFVLWMCSFFPSLFEGLPFTLVEAQAEWTALCDFRQDYREVVLDEERVCCLSLENSDTAWAAKVLSYKGCGREEPQITKKRLVAAHFDIHNEADRLLELYNR